MKFDKTFEAVHDKKMLDYCKRRQPTTEDRLDICQEVIVGTIIFAPQSLIFM